MQFLFPRIVLFYSYQNYNFRQSLICALWNEKLTFVEYLFFISLIFFSRWKLVFHFSPDASYPG